MTVSWCLQGILVSAFSCMRPLWWDTAWCWWDPLDQEKPRWVFSRYCLQFYSQWFCFWVLYVSITVARVLVLWDTRCGNNSSERRAIRERWCVRGGSHICPQPQVYHHGTAVRGVWPAHTRVVSDAHKVQSKQRETDFYHTDTFSPLQ